MEVDSNDGAGNQLLGNNGVIPNFSTGWVFDASQSYKMIFYVLAGACFICTVQMCLMPKLKRLEPGVNLKPSEQ